MQKLLIVICVLAICSPALVQNKTVDFKSTNIFYEGRINYRSDAVELAWPGTSVYLNFEGTGVSAVMQDLDTANYYNVILDGKVISKIHTTREKQTYALASGLEKGPHSLQLFKRTEWDKGTTLFFGFELPQGAKLLAPPAPKKRKIEFYGNSITCGYANEDFAGKDRGFGYFQNNYLTYAAITARHFDAQYYCNSKSGIGIMVSWFPMIMPEMYDRTNPNDPESKWDFSQYTPDIVVINLFQNDSWLVNRPNHESFKQRFKTQAPDEAAIIEAYKDFVASVRGKYPNASIICALGSMDATRKGSAWPGYIEEAVKKLDDKKIYTCFFDYKNAHGHPNVKEQQVMADTLINFIEKNIQW